ncbi:hypothetical protein L1887_55325 [Cichorium endivia]|nr:hypothetical protein L1887_55325 [Cichorium endivia]
MQQILLVQRVHAVLRVVVDDAVRDEQRSALVRAADAVERETTGQTRHAAKQRFERLGEGGAKCTHEQDLRVALAAVAGTRALAGTADLDDDNVRDHVAFELVETRVDLGVVELLGTFGDGLEHERLGVDLGIDAEDVEHDTWRGTVVAAADDHAVADEEEELALVVVLEAGERVDGLAQLFFGFGVAGHLADDKLVLLLGRALGAELERGDELGEHRGDQEHREAEQEVVLHLAARRVAEVGLADVEYVVEAGLGGAAVGGVEAGHDLGKVGGDVLARLALEEGDERGVEKVVGGVGLVDVEGVELGGGVGLERARGVDGLGDGGGVVGGGLEGKRGVGDERLAAYGEGHGEVFGEVLACELEHEVGAGLEVGDVRVVALVELGKVVDGAADGGVVVVLTRVLAELALVPRLVVVWAEETAEADDVEEDDGAEPKDDGADGELFAPGHLDVGTFHAAALCERKGRDPPGGEPAGVAKGSCAFLTDMMAERRSARRGEEREAPGCSMLWAGIRRSEWSLCVTEVIHGSLPRWLQRSIPVEMGEMSRCGAVELLDCWPPAEHSTATPARSQSGSRAFQHSASLTAGAR